MHKVAAVSKRAIAFSKETHTLFGLVKAVLLVVFSKFMRSMSKLALVFVRTKTKLYELFT